MQSILVVPYFLNSEIMVVASPFFKSNEALEDTNDYIRVDFSFTLLYAHIISDERVLSFRMKTVLKKQAFLSSLSFLSSRKRKKVLIKISDN